MRSDKDFKLAPTLLRFTIRVLRFTLHVLLPKTCAHCKEDLHYLAGGSLCPACSGSLEPITGHSCRKCGLPLDSGGEYCFNCRGQKGAGLKAELVRSSFAFNPELRSLIHAFKYRGRKDLAQSLGLELVRAYDRCPEFNDYKFVIAVPLFREKERERGFNQAELLAGVLAREKNLFLLKGAVERVKNTPSQTGLSKEARRENVREAFKVTAPELVKGRRILIVDDVATTLATTNELTRTLIDAGATGVAVLTLAREL